MKRISRILVGVLVLSGVLLGSTALAAPVKVRTAMDVLKNMMSAMNTVNTAEGTAVFKTTFKSPIYKEIPPKKKPISATPTTGKGNFGIENTTSGWDYTLGGERKVVGSKTTNVNFYLNYKKNDEAKASELAYHLDFKTDKEKSTVVEGEVRVFENEVYVKLNKLDVSDAISKEFSSDKLSKIKSILGQWIKIDDKTIASEVGRTSSLGSSLLGAKEDLSAEEQEATDYVTDLITRHKVFIITALRNQTISGQPTYHYSIALNKRGLANAAAEAAVKYKGQVSEYSLSVKKTEAQLRADYFKSLNKLKLPTIEVWIGRNDFVLYKYDIRYSLSLQALLKVPYSFTMSFLNTVKSVNKPVTISVPEGARGYEEVGESLFGEERKIARDSRRLSDLRMMQTALEFYYTDYSHYPTTTADGLDLGEENTRCLDKTGFKALCDYSGSYDVDGNYVSNYPYLSYMPKDPKDGKYWYISQDGTTYSIKTDLEAGTADLPKGQIVAQPSGITSTNPVL